MTVISDNRGSLAHYPTGCAKNYCTKDVSWNYNDNCS